MQHHETQAQGNERLAVGLGWFSIALGVAELTAPRSLARTIGLHPDDRTAAVLRAFGARELANGLAILAQPERAAWMWGRVGGDGIDLSYLASGLGDAACDRGRIGAAMGAVLGVTALDVVCATQLSRHGASAAAGARQHAHVQRVITINRPIEEVYAFWKNFENFPRFMKHVDAVQRIDDRRSHWRVKAPMGATVAWDAEITEDRENEVIAWQSLDSADVEHHGSVHFHHAPAARGTEVRVTLHYRPPAGALGRTIAWLFGEEPDQQLHDDLRRFKQLIETGEIPVSEGPGLRRAAQPPATAEQIKTLAGVTS